MASRPKHESGVQTLAMHGFRCELSDAWDLLINRGEWNGGFAMFAESRSPRLNITWERSKHRADFPRSLAKLAKTMRKEHQAELIYTEEFGKGERKGLIGRFRAADGDFHVAYLAPHPDTAFSIVFRQLQSGSIGGIRRIAESCELTVGQAVLPWRLHGVAVDLPITWNLIGVHNVVGLLRMVWFHYPVSGKKANGVLALRRYACASRMMEGKTLSEWVRSRLAPKETIEEEDQAADGLYTAKTVAPGMTWWRRLRGLREERQLHAWIDEDRDRLMLQECRGDTDPLPALRYPIEANTGRSFSEDPTKE